MWSSLVRLPRCSLAVRRFAADATPQQHAVATEFTLAPYREVLSFGMGRGTNYCMITLLHPAFKKKTMVDIDKMYDDKIEARTDYMNELFAKADANRSGNLDKQELHNILQTAGIPPTQARINQLMTQFGSGTRLDPEQFRYMLDYIWGSSISLDFRGDLSSHIGKTYQGERGVAFVGRGALTHQLLRAFRHSWPYHVRGMALMQNTEANPDLDPSKMKVFLEVYAPSVPEEMGSVFRFAQCALTKGAGANWTAPGGFAVRLRGPSVAGPGLGDEILVPLVILPENGAAGIPGELNTLDQAANVYRSVMVAFGFGGMFAYIAAVVAHQLGILKVEPAKS